MNKTAIWKHGKSWHIRISASGIQTFANSSRRTFPRMILLRRLHLTLLGSLTRLDVSNPFRRTEEKQRTLPPPNLDLDPASRSEFGMTHSPEGRLDQTALAGVEPVGELSMSLILPQGLGGLWKLTKDYSSPPRPFPGTHYLHAIPYEGEVEMEGGRLLAWDSGGRVR